MGKKKLRKLIFIAFFTQIFLIHPNDGFGQENLGMSSESAALAGANTQVGVSFGGISVASVALAAAVVTSLISFTLKDSNAASSTSSSN